MKHYYGKIRNIFKNSDILMFQMTDDDTVYVATPTIIAGMTDWLYQTEFVDKDTTGAFLRLQPGERLTLKDGYDLTEDGPDLDKFWHDLYWRDEAPYPARAQDTVLMYMGGRVRFCETRFDKVLLNEKYYQAMEQATKGGLVYAGRKNQPVQFYDSPAEIYLSTFYGCVFPINYAVGSEPVIVAT